MGGGTQFDFTECHSDSSDVTWIHLISFEFIWFQWISFEFIWFHLNSLDVIWVQLISFDFTLVHLVSRDFIWYHVISFDFMWIHLISFESFSSWCSQWKREHMLAQGKREKLAGQKGKGKGRPRHKGKGKEHDGRFGWNLTRPSTARTHVRTHGTTRNDFPVTGGPAGLTPQPPMFLEGLGCSYDPPGPSWMDGSWVKMWSQNKRRK